MHYFVVDDTEQIFDFDHQLYDGEGTRLSSESELGAVAKWAGRGKKQSLPLYDIPFSWERGFGFWHKTITLKGGRKGILIALPEVF